MGDPERDARLVLGRAAPEVARRAGGARSRARAQKARRSSTSAASRAARTPSAVPVEEEAARVVPLVERLAADGRLVSVDTWRAPVARRALAAGAAMINDVSGLADPELADACAETRRGARDHPHAHAAEDEGLPRLRRRRGGRRRVPRRARRARARSGRRRGAASCSTPASTSPRLRPSRSSSCARCRGSPSTASRCCSPSPARTSSARSPAGRRRRATRARSPRSAPACAAALGILRVHDVAGARDYLNVHAALENGAERSLELAEGLRREVL